MLRKNIAKSLQMTTRWDMNMKLLSNVNDNNFKIEFFTFPIKVIFIEY